MSCDDCTVTTFKDWLQVATFIVVLVGLGAVGGCVAGYNIAKERHREWGFWRGVDYATAERGTAITTNISDDMDSALFGISPPGDWIHVGMCGEHPSIAGSTAVEWWQRTNGGCQRPNWDPMDYHVSACPTPTLPEWVWGVAAWEGSTQVHKGWER